MDITKTIKSKTEPMILPIYRGKQHKRVIVARQ